MQRKEGYVWATVKMWWRRCIVHMPRGDRKEYRRNRTI